MTSPQPTAAAAPTNPPSKVALPKTDALDAVLTALFAIWFGLTLLVFEAVQQIALKISPRLHERSVVGLNRSLLFALKLAGARFNTEYRGRPSADRPLIIISNHQSLFDIPLLHLTFVEHYPRYIAKKELVTRWLPSVTFNLRHGGSAIIDRSDPRQALPEIKRVAEIVNRDKRALVLFPEGTRGRDGQLKPFKTGGLSALLRSAPDAEIVPVTIDNSWILVARKFGPIPRGIKIKVIVDPPLDRAVYADADTVAERVHALVQTNLASIRGLPPEAVLAAPKSNS